jgi:hypothetical protein
VPSLESKEEKGRLRNVGSTPPHSKAASRREAVGSSDVQHQLLQLASLTKQTVTSSIIVISLYLVLPRYQAVHTEPIHSRLASNRSSNGSPSASLGSCTSTLNTNSAPSSATMDSANPVYSEQPRDDVYGAYDGSYLQNSGPKQATQSPIVTGTSVIALKFKDGVVMAADNLGASPPPLEKSRVTFQS